MTTAVTFIIGFFLGGMAVGFICFCGLTVHFYKKGLDAQEEIYGNDEENNNEAETNPG